MHAVTISGTRIAGQVIGFVVGLVAADLAVNIEARRRTERELQIKKFGVDTCFRGLTKQCARRIPLIEVAVEAARRRAHRADAAGDRRWQQLIILSRRADSDGGGEPTVEKLRQRAREFATDVIRVIVRCQRKSTLRHQRRVGVGGGDERHFKGERFDFISEIARRCRQIELCQRCCET